MHRSCSRRTSTWYDECPFVRSVTTVAAVASFGAPSCACCAVWMCASLTKRIGPEWLQAHRSRMAAGEHRRRPCRVGRVRFAAATSCACHRQRRSDAQRQMGLCNAASHGWLPHQRLPGRRLLPCGSTYALRDHRERPCKSSRGNHCGAPKLRHSGAVPAPSGGRRRIAPQGACQCVQTNRYGRNSRVYVTGIHAMGAGSSTHRLKPCSARWGLSSLDEGIL